MILIVTQKASILMCMIPGSKGLNPHELAHRGERPWDPPRYKHKKSFLLAEKDFFTITDYNQTTHNIQFIT